MTALAPALPTPQLVRSDVLKLRKRRGLAVVAALLTIVSVTLTYLIIQIFHWSNSVKYGVAGGVENLGNGVDLLMLLGAAAAAIVGASAGAQDLDAGVYRELVVTGRSRRSLFLSRLTGGLLYLLPFVIVGYTVASIASIVWAGDKPMPSVHLLTVTGLWAVVNVTFYYVLAFGIACITASRSYTIGVLLAFRLALTPLIAAIGALGIVRELIPGVALANLAPDAFLKQFMPAGNVVLSSTASAILVLVVWALLAIGFGSWRDTHRDA